MSLTEDKIGVGPLTALVTGNLVGSGVFMLPVTMASFGCWSLLGWAGASLGAIVLSLIFAGLSSRHTKTGGPYLYAQEAFGPTVGYYTCWGYWMLSWISNPALAVTAVGYLSSIMGEFSPLLQFSLELGIVVSLTLFNLLGLRLTGQFELIVTVLKIIPLGILPLLGLFYVDWSVLLAHVNLTDQSFWSTLNITALTAMWAFVGLETGTVPAGQVQNAKKVVPQATILGTLIAALVYMVGAVVIMGTLTQSQLLGSKAPYSDAAHIIFGGSWALPVTLAAILSCLGTLNGWTMIVGRIPYGAAKDGLFPALFAKTTAQGTPYWGIIVSSCCSIPLLTLSLTHSLMEQFNFIIDVAVTLILLIYTVCTLAFIKLHLKENTFHGMSALLGLAGLCFSLWTLWATSFKMLGMSFSLLLTGIPLHIYMKKIRRKNLQ